jgi:hypothetical protein
VELDIVLKGQSNAALFASLGGLTYLQEDVDNLLGYNGSTNKVDVTSYTAPGTAIVPDPSFPNIQSWLNGTAAGWSSGALEQAFDVQLAQLPAAQKAAPTVILDMQNESDAANPSLTAQTELSADFYEMTVARSVLGQSAAATPVVFMDTPYPDGVPSSAEAIKTAQQELSGTSSFNSTIAASYSDVDMNYEGGVNGGPHLGQQDIGEVAMRTALTVADSFAAYALPGSIISQGLQDWSGPQGTAAKSVATNPSQVEVSVAPGTGSGGLAALGATAASGEGFSLQTSNGSFVQATATSEIDATHLLVTFAGTDVTGGETVYYDYALRRLSDVPDPASELDQGTTVNQTNAANGYGTAVYDDHALPLSLPGTGLAVNGATVSPDMLAQALGTAGTTSSTGTGTGTGGTTSPSAPMSGLTFIAEARALVLSDTGVAPDSGTISAVSQELATGIPLTQEASNLLSIPNPLFDHAGETSAQFVTDLFGNGFGIQATPAQVAPFATDLDNGSLSRASVLVAVATSPAYAVYDQAWRSANGIS